MNGQRAALTPFLPSTSEHRQSGAKARSMETEQRLKRLTGRETNADWSTFLQEGEQVQPSTSASARLRSD